MGKTNNPNSHVLLLAAECYDIDLELEARAETIDQSGSSRKRKLEVFEVEPIVFFDIGALSQVTAALDHIAEGKPDLRKYLRDILDGTVHFTLERVSDDGSVFIDRCLTRNEHEWPSHKCR
jgi:hypothetical protein